MPTKTKRRVPARRFDPSRTGTLRAGLSRELRRRFARVKGKIVTAFLKDDLFDLLPQVTHVADSAVRNAVDSFFAQCERDEHGWCVGTGGGPLGAASAAAKKVKEVSGKLRQKLVDRYGTKTAIAIVGAAQATSWASAAGAVAVGLPGAWIPSPVAALPYVALAELRRQLSNRNEPRDKPTGNAEELSPDELERAARELIADLEAELGEATANANYEFKTDPQRLKAFNEWLRQQFADELAGATEEQLWDKYLGDAFKRGAGRAFDSAKAGKTTAPVGASADFLAGGRDQFLRSAFGKPETKEKLGTLVSRSFTDLRGVTDQVATKMTRTLADALAEGKNPREVVSDLADDMDVGRARAELVARTEIVRAHAEGQLDAFERMGVEELGVEVEWTTAGDGRVCPRCEAMEGVVLRIEDSRNLIPLHPNCRCAFMPANVGEDDSKQVRDPDEIAARFAEAGIDPKELGDALEPLIPPLRNLLVNYETANAFCPTGPGGGVNPTCSPNQGADKGGLSGGARVPKGRQKVPDTPEVVQARAEEIERAKSNDTAPRLQTKLTKLTTAHITDQATADAIGVMTSRAAEGINERLRTGTATLKEQETTDLFQQAILGAPVLKEPVTVFRGIHLTTAERDHLISEVTTTGEYVSKSFVHTSLAAGKAYSFSRDPNALAPDWHKRERRVPVLLQIQATHGLALGGRFGKHAEKEVVLPKGTKFKLTRVSKSFGGAPILHLTQVVGGPDQ